MTTPCVLALAVSAAAPGVAAADPVGPAQQRVVVLAAEDALSVAQRAVVRQGGRLERRLPAIGALVARVPRRSVARLRAARGVASVSRDRSYALSDATPTGGALAGVDGAAMDEVRAAVDADGGGGGAGVDVALVDSGVTPVAGLADSSVVVGPDFSDEAGNPELADLDGFGHGTHLAGVIVGRDKTTGFAGLAPDARLVSVKVAGHDGGTSLSQILAGIDWVVHNRKSDGMNIRVLNLAFGASASGTYRQDPLSAAVEVAWRRGITVVTSAGNGGNETAELDSPAWDPYVIAVGADATNGTADPADDTVADFSSRGSATRSPDLLAPGVGIVSLRVPDSFLDQQFPQARNGETGFRGSGTSQSAAVVSGVAARLIAGRPELAPDSVKAMLRSSARPLGGASERLQGEGLISAAGAALATSAGSTQRWPHATHGAWRGARAGVQLAPPEGDASRWSASRWSASRWSASRWSASRWSASRWSASRWSASRWSASRWSSAEWPGTR